MKVSVVITAYNSEKTIYRAINGVLKQKVNFDYEVIVSDDGSTDSTNKIISTFFKERVRYINNGHVGYMPNFAQALDACNGEYIAFCDGDDYWTNDLKLQNQVDYMDLHSECSLCHTNTLTMTDKWEDQTKVFDNEVTYDSMLVGGTVYILTAMIRASHYNGIMHKFIKLHMNSWDYPLVLHYTRCGKIYKLEDFCAVYMIYTESYSHTHSRIKRVRVMGGVYWVRLYYIIKYGCKPSTFFYLIYKFTRDLYSIIFKRWYK